MMRRTPIKRNNQAWAFPSAQTLNVQQGPPAVGTPISMNQTKENALRDTTEEYFPLRIRGHNTMPDVPHKHHFIKSWWMLGYSNITQGEFTPWRAFAPHGSFRFRQFSSKLDSHGSKVVKKLRMHENVKQDASGVYSAHPINEGHGSNLPPKEMYLTRMAGIKKETSSLCTSMDRFVQERLHLSTTRSPRQEQHDVGRLEPISPIAGQISPDTSSFPFRQKTEDFYEYEITKARLKRFELANADDSEVTYTILISSLWDHHLEKLAEDLVAFLRDVGKQALEAKLFSVRNSLNTFERCDEVEGIVSLIKKDKNLVESFNSISRSPFDQSKMQSYDLDEISQLVRTHLFNLETACLARLSTANNAKAEGVDIYNPAQSWPYAETMEPWTKMVEYWAHNKTDFFTKHESSTKKTEFRRFFRQVKVNLPFHSPEFEKRLLDTKHWLHRGCTAEYHTVYKRNVIQDFSTFPVERDSAVTPNHEYHRLLSYAFDWQNSPPAYITSTTVGEGESWESVSDRLGCPLGDLQRLNSSLSPSDKLETGARLSVPPSSTKRVTEIAAVPRYIDIQGRYASWQAAADALDCELQDLQKVNAHIASGSPDKFPEDVTQLRVPEGVSIPSNEETFAVTETVFENDSFETISLRLGCSVEDLKKANSNVQGEVTEVTEVLVPTSATHPRRVVDPWLRSEGASAAIMSQTVSEAGGLPRKLPTKPENAELFPAEYETFSSTIPRQPKELLGSEDWLSYTARYLDTKIDIQTAQSTWNDNPLWPMEQVPGKREQTPFEEDFTWLNLDTPLQTTEMFHADGWVQDQHTVNNEQFDQSLDWQAP